MLKVVNNNFFWKENIQFIEMKKLKKNKNW
jgi:hypothetical protein